MKRPRISKSKLIQLYTEDAVRFIKKHPAFPQAYNYLISSRAAEIRAIITTEEMELVSAAIADGRSPAEAIYRMAGQRGWKPPKKKEPLTAERLAKMPAKEFEAIMANIEKHKDVREIMAEQGWIFRGKPRRKK